MGCPLPPEVTGARPPRSTSAGKATIRPTPITRGPPLPGRMTGILGVMRSARPPIRAPTRPGRPALRMTRHCA